MIVDRILGIVFLAVAIGAAWHAQTLDVPFAADPVGPRVFPTLVALLLGVCGAAILFRPQKGDWEIGHVGRVVLVAVASLVYPYLLGPIGFVPATSCLCFLLALAFGARPVAGAISAVVTSFVLLLVIDYLLDLPLPRGPLGI